MRPFRTVRSMITPLDRANVDTDQIVPKQFLKLVQRSGFGRYLFYNWRYEGANEWGGKGGGASGGITGEVPAGGRPRPGFVLNDPRYEGSAILVAGENFGCGSSREHAVWALADHGFSVVIAPSFADIFYGNCFKNGLLPIALSREEVATILIFSGEVEVDLKNKIIRFHSSSPSPPGPPPIHFGIEEHRRLTLLEGLDEIAQTLKYEGEISGFENAAVSRRGAAPPMIPRASASPR